MYRKNVAAFIINDQGLILTCKRADKFKDWQIPQGGIDSGESPEEAVIRELKEEVGMAPESLQIIKQLDSPIKYDWPKDIKVNRFTQGFVGQEQYFFLLKCPTNWVPNFAIGPYIEFEAYSWDDARTFRKKVEPTFRAKSYKKALEEFMLLCPDMIIERRDD